MSLDEKVKNSRNLSQQDKLVMLLISSTLKNPSVTEIVSCLQSEPYGLAVSEILNSLKTLNNIGLIKIKSFSINREEPSKILTHITFTEDWIFKL